MSDFFHKLQSEREEDRRFWIRHPEFREKIIDQAYPDKAHFVYELLQNAEDALADTVEFELFDSHLVLTHNGKRLFTERDVEAITDVSKSTKENDLDSIGKHGVGFKSVFKYTNSPRIFSGNFNFEIIDFVYPKIIDAMPNQDERTYFIFPFNSPKRTIKESFSEVRIGLEQLAEDTLLYLKNLRCIRWKIGNSDGEFFKYKHAAEHIEILRKINNKRVSSSHWLCFMSSINNASNLGTSINESALQNLSLAFEAELISDKKVFDARNPMTEQLKIVTTAKGKVAVFFPADKETSNLRFHLHAPFVTDLSRSSVKDVDANQELFKQLAKLAANSLHRIKDLGLLTGEFLAVLPNDKDQLPDRYQCIRDAIIQEMRAQPLTPTYARGFAPATKLFQAPALMKRLLSDQDLSFLLERTDSPTWAIGANQKGSAQDRFLESLDIQTWGEWDLANFLSERACAETYGDETDLNAVHKWLDTKPDEWHQSLYEILYKYCEEADEYIELEGAQIVRLEGGGYAVGREAYFSTETLDPNDPFPRVAQQVLTSGTKKTQEGARRFLEKIGVRVPEEADEIKHILKTRYGFEGDPPSDEIYIADLERFISFAEKNPYERQMFTDAYLFEGMDSGDGIWCTADGPSHKNGHVIPLKVGGFKHEVRGG